MSKRTKTDSNVVNPKNFWPTPLEAARPLAAILPPFSTFDEPCAGDGALVRHLESFGHTCTLASDTEPREMGIIMMDATDFIPTGDVITNPPFTWSLLKPLMDHWVGTVPTWLLLPWDMLSNVYMSPYVPHVDQVLPLGRVSWMQNNKSGFENFGWFHFGTGRVNLILPRTGKVLPRVMKVDIKDV